MPVRRTQADRFVIDRCIATPKRLCQDVSEGTHPSQDMEAMSSGQNVQKGTMQGRWEVHSRSDHLGPRDNLADQKGQSQGARDTDPGFCRTLKALCHCLACHFDRDAAGEQQGRGYPEY